MPPGQPCLPPPGAAALPHHPQVAEHLRDHPHKSVVRLTHRPAEILAALHAYSNTSSSSSARSRVRPRASRDLTVPTGICSICETSSMLYPSM